MSLSFNERYPVRYEEPLTLKNGKAVFIRPIRETDEALIRDLFGKLEMDSVYLRFLTYLKSLPEDLLYQLTHIDYCGRFALVAVTRDEGRESIIAVARYFSDPASKTGDFAVVVRNDWQNRGLGRALLLKIFAAGKERGIASFVSVINTENHVMKHILRELGYRVEYSYVKGSTQAEIFV